MLKPDTARGFSDSDRTHRHDRRWRIRRLPFPPMHTLLLVQFSVSVWQSVQSEKLLMNATFTACFGVSKNNGRMLLSDRSGKQATLPMGKIYFLATPSGG